MTPSSVAFVGRRLHNIVHCIQNVRREGATNHTRGACAPRFTRELEQLHPDNRHVRDKIRQQLQVLRDTGLLLHVVRLRFASPRQERGVWRLP